MRLAHLLQFEKDSLFDTAFFEINARRVDHVFDDLGVHRANVLVRHLRYLCGRMPGCARLGREGVAGTAVALISDTGNPELRYCTWLSHFFLCPQSEYLYVFSFTSQRSQVVWSGAGRKEGRCVVLRYRDWLRRGEATNVRRLGFPLRGCNAAVKYLELQ